MSYKEINDVIAAIEMSNATTHTSDGVYRSELVDLYSIKFNLYLWCNKNIHSHME